MRRSLSSTPLGRPKWLARDDFIVSALNPGLWEGQRDASIIRNTLFIQRHIEVYYPHNARLPDKSADDNGIKSFFDMAKPLLIVFLL